MLVNSKKMLEEAKIGHYAVPAANIVNLENIKGVIEAAEETKHPLMVCLAEVHTPTLGIEEAAAIVKYYAEKSNQDIALHYDHGFTIELVKKAIDVGFTSVMIDGSSLPFKENIELTREVVKYAHARGVSVEGELGVLAGVEDHVFSASSTYTNPLDAVEFFQKTGVDALAISYGTMHGASKGKDVKLRKEIAIAIRECMNHLGIFGALVSHGSSTVPKYIVDEINGLGGELTNTYGISIEELKSAIPCGISKINVDTDIRLAVTRNMKELFAKYPEKRSSSSIGAIYELLESKKNQFDPRVFLPPIMDTVMYGNIPDDDVAAIVDCVERGVREVVGTLIVQFGSFGKAPLVEQVSLDEMAERYKKMK